MILTISWDNLTTDPLMLLEHYPRIIDHKYIF